MSQNNLIFYSFIDDSYWHTDYDGRRIPEETKPEEKPNSCRWGHDWKRYEGFSFIYDYCTRCDAKKDAK